MKSLDAFQYIFYINHYRHGTNVCGVFFACLENPPTDNDYGCKLHYCFSVSVHLKNYPHIIANIYFSHVLIRIFLICLAMLATMEKVIDSRSFCALIHN